MLQFPVSTEREFEAIISLETALIAHFATLAEVDGHDAGSGEMNIFIFTDNPTTTFESIRQLVENQQSPPCRAAAFRKIDENEFTIIWPKDSTQKFSVA